MSQAPYHNWRSASTAPFGASIPPGLIYRHDPATIWDNIPGGLIQISVRADAVVWGINASGSVYRYQ